MKRITILLIALFLTICSYSQEHIRFNGATFGKSVTEFVKEFPGSPSLTTIYHKAPKGFNPNLCNRDLCYIKLNSQDWNCHIFSSRSTKTVFRTVSVGYFYKDLESQLMLLVKTLEEKYGGGVKEQQGNLGEIVGHDEYHKEMLALYYYIKGSNGKRIGEIRISTAPTDRNARNGYIELSYTDYSSQEKATKEYNSLMRNAL